MSRLPRAGRQWGNGGIGRPTGAALPVEDAQSALQRVLLNTDGSVVELLEVYFDEPIRVAGLVQVRAQASSADGELELSGHEAMLRRKVLLQGSRSGKNHVYSEACLVLDRLEPSVREQLMATSETVGRLLVASPVETFREVLSVGRRRAGSLATRFGIDERDELLVRTYRVIAGGRPIMLATECFPTLHLPASSENDPERVAALDGNASLHASETAAPR